MTQQATGTYMLTPPGRLIGGSPFEANTKDSEGNPLLIKHGPNAGQPRVEFAVGIAIPKTDVTFETECRAKIHQKAREAFPQLFDAQGNCLNPAFAFKITDGDSAVPNSKGNAPVNREGYAGHWILWFSNGFAPKCYAAGGQSVLTDPESIKKGYYVRIYGEIKGNGSLQQPGVFLNHSMIELIGYGQEIVSGPDGAAVFGAQPVAALPQGASATPVAPATQLAQGQVQTPPPQPTPTPGAQVPPPQPTPGAQVPPPPVQPNTAILNAAPPPPVATKRLLNGVVYEESALLASKYTQEQIAALPVAQ
jgi:hypothetical protein